MLHPFKMHISVLSMVAHTLGRLRQKDLEFKASLG
jgi:hypothetical protein